MERLPLELLPCLLVGLLLGWKLPWLPTWLAPPLIRWGVPLSLAALLLRSPLSSSLLRVGLVGVLAPVLTLALPLAWPPLRRQIGHRVLILGAAVGNTGYWGLPVAIALLPPQTMAAVAAYDVAGTFITWSVGPLVLLGARGSLAKVASTFFASPALQGLALSVVVGQTPWHAALAQALWWPARLVFLVALTLVGMRLGLTLRDRSLVLSAGLPWALLLKLVVAPVMVWFLANLFHLPSLEREALVLQGAAPTALSVLFLAEARKEAVPLASTLVLTSTVLAMITVPLWWSLIRG
jgi:predicted permease